MPRRKAPAPVPAEIMPMYVEPVRSPEEAAMIAETHALGTQWAERGIEGVEADFETVFRDKWGAPGTDRALAEVTKSYATALAGRYIREVVQVEKESPDAFRDRLERLRFREMAKRIGGRMMTVRSDAPPEALEKLSALRDRIGMASMVAQTVAEGASEEHLRSLGAYMGLSVQDIVSTGVNRQFPLLTPDEQEALIAWGKTVHEGTHPNAERLSGDKLAPPSEWREALRGGVPFVGAWIEEEQQLAARCERLATPEDVDAYTLTREDGTRVQSPEAWLAELTTRGEQHRYDAPEWMRIGFEELLTEAAIAGEKLEKQKREEAEAKLAALKKQLAKERKPGLPDHVVFPGHFVRSAFDSARFKRLKEQIDAQPELFSLVGSALEVIQAEAEANIETAQLSRLSGPELQSIYAAFRLFTYYGDDHKVFTRQKVSVSANVLYQAAGVTNSKGYAALFQGMIDASSRTLRIAYKMPLQKMGRAGRGFAVLGVQTTIFNMVPIWVPTQDKRRSLTEEEAESLAEEWTRRPKKWTKRLPDFYELELPDVMRNVGTRLVLPGDTLNKLEEGSKKVRGKQAGLEGADYTLLMEIVNKRQSSHLSDDGLRMKSYVDREGYLIAKYGREEIMKWRKRGTLKAKALKPYLTSVQVLIESGRVVSWTPDYRTTRGELRDVFELAPEVVIGTEAKLHRKAEQQELALKGASRARKVGSKRGGSHDQTGGKS